MRPSNTFIEKSETSNSKIIEVSFYYTNKQPVPQETTCAKNRILVNDRHRSLFGLK